MKIRNNKQTKMAIANIRKKISKERFSITFTDSFDFKKEFGILLTRHNFKS